LAEETGEEGGVDSLSGDKDEKTFLLDEELQFRSDVRSTGEQIFAWRDLSGDVGDLWEFVCDSSVKAETGLLFERVALQCQYERKYRRSHDNATEEDLEALAYFEEPIPDASPVSSPIRRSPTIAAPPDPAELFPNTTKEKMAKKVAGKAQPPKSEDPTTAPPAASEPEALGTLAEAIAELHLFDFPSGTFVRQDEKVRATVTEIGNWEYWLHIVGDDREWLGQPIIEDVNPVFNYEYKSFIFNHYLDDGSAYSWLIRFSEQEDLEHFQQGIMQALWEHNHQVKWGKAKDTDRDYVLEAFQDLTMEDAPGEEGEEDEEDEEEEEEYEDADEGHRSEHYDEDESEDDTDAPEKDGAENSQLAVGYKHDRSFVVRGNKIGVFKHTPDDQLQFSTAISNVKTPKGKAFNPSKVMLHAEDTNLIMQSADNPNSVYRMDLETGTVVDEWKVHDDIPLKFFAPEDVSCPMLSQ
jgi:hypothetical protein